MADILGFEGYISGKVIPEEEVFNIDTIRKKLPEFVINVKEYGAKCDGITDDTAAIQAAIDAAPNGSTILIGNCRLHSGLTITKFLKIKGYSFINGNYSGAYPTSKMYFDMNLPVAINVIGVNVCFEDIVITGIGKDSSTGIGIKLTDGNLSLNNAIIQSFYKGIQITNGYYNKLQNSYIGYCTFDAEFNHCYNINAVNMTWKAEKTCIMLLNNSNLNLFGGSIEAFNSCGIYVNTSSRVHVFGTYFKGITTKATAGIYLETGCSVESIGCHTYLTTMLYFIYSNSDNIRIFSRHNFFVYPTDSSSVRVYNFKVNASNLIIDISGDNWDTSAGPYVSYCMSSGIYAQTNTIEIIYPPNHPNYPKNISTKNNTQKPSKVTPTVEDGTIINFANAGFGTDDPIGLHTTAWGYRPYRAIYQKGQWEKIGIRLPNQPNSTATNLATLKADFNALLTKLRANGVMV